MPIYDGNAGYFFDGNEVTLVIDEFSHTPITYPNILVMFDRFNPTGCTPRISVNGTLITGNSFSAGDLVVSTPTPYGRNYDGVQNSGECFTAYTHDLTAVPVQEKTWGSI